MERPVLLLKRILPSLSIHSLALVDIDPAIMGMLENAASGALFGQTPPSAHMYASYCSFRVDFSLGASTGRPF
jgi:hypothetical protein